MSRPLRVRQLLNRLAGFNENAELVVCNEDSETEYHVSIIEGSRETVTIYVYEAEE